MNDVKPPHTYNIKFNKTLFRKALIADTRSALVGWLIALLLVVGGFQLSVREIIPNWLFIIFVVISLYLLVAPIWTLSDWLEYRRIHVTRRKAKKRENA
jgi:hypothetical protein